MTNKETKYRINEKIDGILAHGSDQDITNLEKSIGLMHLEALYVDKCENGTEVIEIPGILIDLKVRQHNTEIEILDDRINPKTLLKLIEKYVSKYNMILQQGYYANVHVGVEEDDFRFHMEAKHPSITEDNKLIFINTYSRTLGKSYIAGGIQKDGKMSYDLEDIVGEYTIGDINSKLEFVFYW